MPPCGWPGVLRVQEIISPCVDARPSQCSERPPGGVQGANALRIALWFSSAACYHVSWVACDSRLHAIRDFLATRPGGACAELPLFDRMVLEWLRDRLRARRVQEVTMVMVEAGPLFRVDAKAEGMTVAIGGWAPERDHEGTIRKDRSKWFSMRLSREEAPWAFARGLPSGSISTLELLASLVGLILLVPPETLGRGTMTITGFTDSQVSASAVARGMSTAFPLCCVVMELAAQLEHRGLDLCLEWAPRDKNAEADALADGRTEGFSQDLRVGRSVQDLPWRVLPGLLRAGEAFYAASKKRPRPAAEPVRGRRLAGDRLKDREPW